MDKLAQNSFSNGLALDNSPFVQVNSTLKNCLNGTILTFKGNEYVLQNDLGNGKVGLKDKEGNIEYVKLSEGFVPLGVKEHGGIIYIVSKNPKTGQEEIGSFPSPEYDTLLNTITLKDSYTIDYESDYTEKIFKTTAINVGDVINFSYESNSSSGPTINIWDLNNVKDENEPNRMANFQIIFNSKESNNVDRTEELFNSKVKKTDSNVFNENRFNENGYNTTLEDYIIKERNTKITLKVTPSKIQSLTAGTGGNVENNKLYLQQDYLLFKYDCPDGDVNYPYQYQNSTGREVNYFKKIKGTIQKSGGGQLEITNFLDTPTINKKDKIYTRLYTINSNNFTQFEENDKLQITVTGVKTENGETQEFITYKSGFLDLITNNIQLLSYKPNVEINKYFRFVWNRIDKTIIWGKDKNPYTDDIYDEGYNLNSNSIKIWYVAPFQSKIAIFNMSNPKHYGRILNNRQVGQAVQKSQEVENSQLLYRSIYEFIKDTDESDKDYYLVIAFDIKNDSLIIKDVEYFFPLLSVYKNNTIPCSITYNAADHSDNLKPDAFGNKYGYYSDDYKGQNEIITNGKPICVFGRQMTDSGRNFKLTLDNNNELHGLLLTTNDVDGSEFINYSYEVELNNDDQINQDGENIYIDITNLQSSGYKNCKYIYGYLYKPSIENAGPNGAITHWNKVDQNLKWTKKDYKDYLCEEIYNDDGHVGLKYDNPYSAYFKILLDKTNLINTLSFDIKADDLILNVKDGIWFYEDNLDVFNNTTTVSVINNCISKLNVCRIKDCTLFQSDNSIKFTYTNPGSSVLIQVENKGISEYFKDFFDKVFTPTGNLYDLLVVDIIKQDNIVNYLEKSENDILVFIRRNDGNSVSIFYPNLGKDSEGNNIRLEAVIPDFEEHYLKNSENETNITEKTLYNYDQQQNYSNQSFTLENFNLLLKDINKDKFIYRKLSEEDTSLLESFRKTSNINNDIYYTINPSLLNENKFINVEDYSIKRKPQNVTWHYATFDGNSSNNSNFFDGYAESNFKIYQYNDGELEKLFIFPKNHNCKVIYNRIGKKIRVDFNDFDDESVDYYFKTDKFVIFCNKNTNLVNSCNYKKDTLTLNCTPDYVSTNIKPCPYSTGYQSKYFVL